MQRRYRKPRPEKEIIKKFRFNEEIRVPQVFLIDDTGEQIGAINTSEALNRARDKELDLVEVNPLANPPVVKIMDYSQYRYEMEKKMRKAKAHQKAPELKAIRLTFRIKGKDLETRIKQALDFLGAGHKVKIELILKGRERAHASLALDKVKEFIAALGPDIKIVQPICLQGGLINVVLDK
jgi:translation initiation factor IF-3